MFHQKINKHINRDLLKLTVHWIRANTLSLNTTKTEIAILKARNKTIIKHLIFPSVFIKLSSSIFRCYTLG